MPTLCSEPCHDAVVLVSFLCVCAPPGSMAASQGNANCSMWASGPLCASAGLGASAAHGSGHASLTSIGCTNSLQHSLAAPTPASQSLALPSAMGALCAA